MEQIWNSVLDLMARLVTPDWGSLIALIPIAIVALVVVFFIWLIWRTTALGPRRRGIGRVRPVPPAGVHMPGGSFAPIFAAVGAALVLFGLVFGGTILLLGVLALVLTLLYWGAESMREYDRAAGAGTTLPAVIREPPAGVHMPGPSFRPILVAMAVTVLFYGLVFGGWLLPIGVLMLIVTLVGWLRDARAEYVLAERADESGHLESLPAPRVPKGTFVLFGVLFVFGVILNSGIIPSGEASGANAGASPAPGGSSAPGGSGAPAASGAASQAATDLTVTAEGVKYDAATLAAGADKAFTIAFVNKDSGIPHNIQIADSGGTLVFEGDTITGPAQAVYNVPALKAGAYKFSCKWHPNMVGDLTVK